MEATERVGGDKESKKVREIDRQRGGSGGE